jgi:hypothetical protein
MAALGSFYGLEPRWLRPDRLYKIFVSEHMLACAYVAGQFYDNEAAGRQLQSAGIFMWPLVRKWLAQRKEREQRYDSEDPFSPLFLHLDPRNVQITRSDIAQIRLDRRRLRGKVRGVWNAGSIKVALESQRFRKWILVDDQNPDDVLVLLQKFWPDTETIGTSPVTISRSTSEAGEVLEYSNRRRRYRLDDLGIGECDLAGEALRFIAWPDLHSIGQEKLCPASGPAIRVKLAPPWHKTFMRVAEQRWRSKCPSAWEQDQLQRAVVIRRLFRIWLPLLFWGLPLIDWLLFVALGFPPRAVQFQETAKRGIVVATVFTVLFWSFDFFVLRKLSAIPIRPEDVSE